MTKNTEFKTLALMLALMLSMMLNVVFCIILGQSYISNLEVNHVTSTTTTPTTTTAIDMTTSTANIMAKKKAREDTKKVHFKTVNGLRQDMSIPRDDILFASKPGMVTTIYGHVHMAKTAGTTINGQLASHFERVCGNKGYSHDAYQLNLLYRRLQGRGNSMENTGDLVNLQYRKWGGEMENTGDLVNLQYMNFNRGRVPLDIMFERGFEDCDYISLEQSAFDWKRVWASLPTKSNNTLKLELHVPCRDPVKHLMSMCNFSRKEFHCAAVNLTEESQKCIGDFIHRFPNHDIPFEKKCFNPVPVEPYLDYMSKRLQRKRIENVYIHRETNLAHKPECIWQEQYADVKKQVEHILVTEYPYFAWCQKCLGSKDDLLAPKY